VCGEEFPGFGNVCDYEEGGLVAEQIFCSQLQQNEDQALATRMVAEIKPVASDPQFC
jgi:hypothetical protein